MKISEEDQMENLGRNKSMGKNKYWHCLWKKIEYWHHFLILDQHREPETLSSNINTINYTVTMYKWKNIS